MRLIALCAVALTLATASPSASAIASDDPAIAAHYFAGTWKCGNTTLAFTPLTENRVWTRVAYHDTVPGGIAVMGFVASLHAWIYRDFHSDGAYADLRSPGPSGGRWQWTGPYYPAEGGPPLDGRTTFTQVSPQRFDRTFELQRDRDFVQTGNDTCLKA